MKAFILKAHFFIPKCLIVQCLFMFVIHPLYAHVLISGHEAHQQIEEIKAQTFRHSQQVQLKLSQSSGPNVSAKEMTQLQTLITEYKTRLYFYDQLQLGINSHFKNGELKDFLVKYLLKLSEIEKNSSGTQSQILSESYTYISEALNKIPEKFEDPLEFIWTYLDYSPLTNPKSPESFLQKRNYTNGRDFASGNPKLVSQLNLRTDDNIKNYPIHLNPANSSEGSTPSLKAPLILRTPLNVEK